MELDYQKVRESLEYVKAQLEMHFEKYGISLPEVNDYDNEFALWIAIKHYLG